LCPKNASFSKPNLLPTFSHSRLIGVFIGISRQSHPSGVVATRRTNAPHAVALAHWFIDFVAAVLWVFRERI
jgi:hypothetical protein